jgi:hypothetical protein
MSNAQVRSAEQVAQLTAKGTFQGDVLWWSLRDVELPAEEFKKAWVAAGLSEAALPEMPTPLRVIKNAGQEVFQGELARGLLFRQVVKRDDGSVIFAIVREEPHADGTVTYAQEAKVMVDAQGKLTTDNDTHAQVQQIATSYARLFGKYQAREIRKSIIATVVACDGIMIREAGGVYWVPSKHAQTVRALSGIVKSVGGSTFALLPIHQTPEGSETLGAAARVSITGQLDELAAEMRVWKAEGVGDIRSVTLERRLTEFESLRDRVAMYRDVLSMRADDLNAQLNQLQTDGRALLDSVLASREKPAPAPEQVAAAEEPVPSKTLVTPAPF